MAAPAGRGHGVGAPELRGHHHRRPGRGWRPGTVAFSNPEVLPFTAIGARAALEFGVNSQVAAATKNDLSQVHTVPDPYYVKSAYEASTEQKVLKFVGLPQTGHHPDLLGERRAGADAGARRQPVQLRPAARRAVNSTGTSATATTRWSPAGCTSITSKPATPEGWAASRSSTSRNRLTTGAGRWARPNLQEIDIMRNLTAPGWLFAVGLLAAMPGGGWWRRTTPGSRSGRKTTPRTAPPRPSSCCSAPGPAGRRWAARFAAIATDISSLYYNPAGRGPDREGGPHARDL